MNKKTKQKNKAELGFEQALKRLEDIVASLEGGVGQLDQVVKLFKEGSELVSYCREKLRKVENKIEVISKDLMQSGEKEE